MFRDKKRLIQSRKGHKQSTMWLPTYRYTCTQQTNGKLPRDPLVCRVEKTFIQELLFIILKSLHLPSLQGPLVTASRYIPEAQASCIIEHQFMYVTLFDAHSRLEVSNVLDNLSGHGTGHVTHRGCPLSTISTRHL